MPPHFLEVLAAANRSEFLHGVTVLARQQQPTLARFTAEILGVEAEHRALARQARGRFYEFPGDPLRTRTGFTLLSPAPA